jgi:hypothetical protein
MKFKSELPLSRQISSDRSILLISFCLGLAAFALAVLLQWLIYDDWLHRNGPVRLVGSGLLFVFTSLFAYWWQQAKRDEKIEVLKRLETIRWMNDRIRNSLQAIECVVYATNPHVTDPVRDAVDAIEGVLQEILSETPYSASTVSEASPDRLSPR